MALVKKIITNKSFKGEFQHIEVETITCIMEDGIEISRSSHMSVCLCSDDTKATELGIKALTDIVWTDQMRNDYAIVIEAQKSEEELLA